MSDLHSFFSSSWVTLLSTSLVDPGTRGVLMQRRTDRVSRQESIHAELINRDYVNPPIITVGTPKTAPRPSRLTGYTNYGPQLAPPGVNECSRLLATVDLNFRFARHHQE